MVYVYIADVSCLPDPLVNNDLVKYISEYRKQKILKLRQLQDRKLCLGAGLLQKYVFEKNNISEKGIYTTQKGKPMCDGLFFNMSHSGNYVICATGLYDIGCDIEHIEKIDSKIADRFFCKNESEYLSKFNDIDRIHEFYRLWTVKESYVKMTGDGLAVGLNSFEAAFDGQWFIKKQGILQNCHIKEFSISGYTMAVCFNDDDIMSVPEEVSILDL